MPDFRQLALNFIANNPNIKDTPMNRQIIEAIQNNDVSKGEALANNLCNTFGRDRNSVVNDAQRFFRFL